MLKPTLASDAPSLRGLRVLVTRPARQAVATVALLESRGARPTAFPIIAIEPMLDHPQVGEAVRGIAENRYDLLVFTSENGVRCFFDALLRWWPVSPDGSRGAEFESGSYLEAVRVAAVGPATAAALEEHGVRPSVVAETFLAESLAKGILQLMPKPIRVLVPTALVTREVLPQTLQRAGVVVDVVPIYRTVKASQEYAAELIAMLASIDVVMLTSGSTVQHLCALLGADAAKLLAGTVLASIGPITTAIAANHGLSVAFTAEVSTTVGLVDALERFVAQRR